MVFILGKQSAIQGVPIFTWKLVALGPPGLCIRGIARKLVPEHTMGKQILLRKMQK